MSWKYSRKPVKTCVPDSFLCFVSVLPLPSLSTYPQLSKGFLTLLSSLAGLPIRSTLEGAKKSNSFYLNLLCSYSHSLYYTDSKKIWFLFERWWEVPPLKRNFKARNTKDSPNLKDLLYSITLFPIGIALH